MCISEPRSETELKIPADQPRLSWFLAPSFGTGKMIDCAGKDGRVPGRTKRWRDEWMGRVGGRMEDRGLSGRESTRQTQGMGARGDTRAQGDTRAPVHSQPRPRSPPRTHMHASVRAHSTHTHTHAHSSPLSGLDETKRRRPPHPTPTPGHRPTSTQHPQFRPNTRAEKSDTATRPDGRSRVFPLN